VKTHLSFSLTNFSTSILLSLAMFSFIQSTQPSLLPLVSKFLLEFSLQAFPLRSLFYASRVSYFFSCPHILGSSPDDDPPSLFFLVIDLLWISKFSFSLVQVHPSPFRETYRLRKSSRPFLVSVFFPHCCTPKLLGALLLLKQTHSPPREKPHLPQLFSVSPMTSSLNFFVNSVHSCVLTPWPG